MRRAAKVMSIAKMEDLITFIDKKRLGPKFFVGFGPSRGGGRSMLSQFVGSGVRYDKDDREALLQSIKDSRRIPSQSTVVLGQALQLQSPNLCKKFHPLCASTLEPSIPQNTPPHLIFQLPSSFRLDPTLYLTAL